MSSASKFPGTGQRVAGTLRRTSKMTEPASLASSTDRNRTEARGGHGRITTSDGDYRINPSASNLDTPLSGQGVAEISADKTAPEAPFKPSFNLNIGEQLGNVNVGNRQTNGGGVYKIGKVEKESPEKNETRTQKGAGAAYTPEKTERQEPASENQLNINLGKLRGNFNFGDEQVNEGGKYEL